MITEHHLWDKNYSINYYIIYVIRSKHISFYRNNNIINYIVSILRTFHFNLFINNFHKIKELIFSSSQRIYLSKSDKYHDARESNCLTLRRHITLCLYDLPRIHTYICNRVAPYLLPYHIVLFLLWNFLTNITKLSPKVFPLIEPQNCCLIQDKGQIFNGQRVTETELVVVMALVST